METQLQFQSSSLIFPLLVLLIIVIKLVKQTKADQNSTPKLPPGPTKLPIIGNLHNHALLDSLPHKSLGELAKKYGPIMHLKLGEVSTIVVSSAEMAKEIMKTHDSIFSYRPSLFLTKFNGYGDTDIVLAPYGGYWRQMRKICTTELLSVGRVRSFRSIREVEVSNLIKSIASCEGRPINLTKKIFALSHTILSKAAFGEKCKDFEDFLVLSRKSIELSSGLCLADLFPSNVVVCLISWLRLKLLKLDQETDRILKNIVEEHKNGKTSETGHAKEDLIDVLLRIQQKGQDLEFPITEKNIRAIIMDMFSAGGDTSATTINWAMAEMMKSPRIMKKAQAEVREVYGKKGFVCWNPTCMQVDSFAVNFVGATKP